MWLTCSLGVPSTHFFLIVNCYIKPNVIENEKGFEESVIIILFKLIKSKPVSCLNLTYCLFIN